MQNPAPDIPGLFADAEKDELYRFVARVQQAAKKDEKETVWSAKNAPGTLRSRLTKWALFVKRRPQFVLHQRVHEIIADAGMDHWAMLDVSATPRDLKSIDMQVQIIVGKCGDEILELLYDQPPRNPMADGPLLTMLITVVLGGMRSDVTRTLNRITTLEKTVEGHAALLFSPKLDGRQLLAAIKSVTTNAKRLIEARAKTRRTDDEAKNATLQERMEGLRDAMDRKKAKEMTDETFRMIVQMTDTRQLDDARQALDAALEEPIDDDNYNPIEDGKPMDSWNLDAEVGHISCRSKPEIYVSLGIPTERLPCFSGWRDPDRCHDTWTEAEDPAPADHKVPAELKWHQVVGLRRLAEAMMARKSLLVLDEVGVGKTLQVLALIAYRILCLRSLEKHGRLPGSFEESPDAEVLPGLVVIVLPPTLIKQWRSEIETWFLCNTIFIAEYTTKWHTDTRRAWWKALKDKTDYPPHHKIILASRSAVFSDATRAFTSKGIVNPQRVEDTLFGAQIGLLVADEIHEVRNFGHRLNTMIELVRHVGFLIALSATPLVTRPQDTVQIGRMMHIPGCTAELARRFESRLRAARKADANRRKQEGGPVNVERAKALRGERISTEEYESPKVQRELIASLQRLFKGSAMRRTIRSLDNLGNPIWGADPPIEIYVFGKLYDHERECISGLVARDIRDGDVGQWQSVS
ncbi:DEAD/DEAH box helicase [Phanerochaete sordida]|uniref:DEAD/DEAH box helicase n=1 Tax=Phanerochaete sordida TaxID=48140 RepID=A0A9P3LJI2_9APHY|nr:DEAD/DEAH box helicase [Phanerochaete sordida]